MEEINPDGVEKKETADAKKIAAEKIAAETDGARERAAAIAASGSLEGGI